MRQLKQKMRLCTLAVAVSLVWGANAAPVAPPGASFEVGNRALQASIEYLVANHALIDLPPIFAMAHDVPVTQRHLLVAQAGGIPAGLFFDSSQISPLGDPAWVASLKGPDTNTPMLNLEQGRIERVLVTGSVKNPLTVARGSDATVRNGQVLSNGRVFLIGAERSTLAKGATITLAPGRAAELGDIRVPFVRVFVAAPTGKPLDVDALVKRSSSVGMFSALFVPAPARRGESGATAIASVSIPAAAPNTNLAAQIAQVEERSVVLRPLPPAAVEDRVVLALSAPVDERSTSLSAIPPASVEERLVIAYAAPLEERSVMFGDIPPATVIERGFLAFAPPVEERSGVLAAIPRAAVEDRLVVAYVAPMEERSVMFGQIPSASVIERGFFAFVPPVEERSELLAAIPPAAVEERVPLIVARAVAPMVTASAQPAPAPSVATPMGKPVPGVEEQTVLAAVKEMPVSEGLLRVAINPMRAAPVTVIAANIETMPRISGEASTPTRLTAVQRKMPSVMIDRKGGFFFM